MESTREPDREPGHLSHTAKSLQRKWAGSTTEVAAEWSQLKHDLSVTKKTRENPSEGCVAPNPRYFREGGVSLETPPAGPGFSMGKKHGHLRKIVARRVSLLAWMPIRLHSG